MRLFWIIALVALLGLLPDTAMAQATQRAVSLERLPTAGARIALSEYTACLFARRPKAVRELLLMDFRTPEYRRKTNILLEDLTSCRLPGRLQMASVLLAGGLAEAAYRHDFGSEGASSGLGRVALIAPQEGSDDGANCVIRKEPALVHALLLSRIESAQELEAMKPLADELSSCMAPGTERRLNKPYFRSVLALALYWATSATAAQTGAR